MNPDRANFSIYPGYIQHWFLNFSKIKTLLLFFVLLPYAGNAQYDSTYISPFKQELSVGMYSYYEFTMLTHEVDEDKNVSYMPNSPVGLGLSVSYKNFSLSGGMGFRFLRNKKLGETRVIDWQYHHYGRKFIFDVFFQNYKGFYNKDENDRKIIHTYPDIKIIQYGAFGQYIFNNKKFSYRAAFDQNERQLKSAGSFQLGGGFYFNQVSSDTTLTINEKNKLNKYQLSISGGYVHTFVIKKNYFAAIGVSAGLNIGTESLSPIKKLELSPSLFPRMSTGYNGSNWSIGLSFVMNRTYVSFNDKLNMLFDTGSAKITFIRRFDVAPHFLHKVKILN